MKRIVNFTLPVTACNLQCHYCFVRQENRATGKISDLKYSLEHIQRALTKERLGGVCHIGVCGLGETLLAEYAVDLIVKLLENGHYVSVVTNGTIRKNIQKLCEIDPELRKSLFVKFSFHYLELKRHKLIEQFFKNVTMVKKSAIAFSVELAANDEMIPDIIQIQKLCFKELGTQPHLVETRNNLDGYSRLTKLSVAEHQKVWESFHSELFEYQQTEWMKKRTEFCYAGDWVINLDAGQGGIIPCFAGGNVIQNIFEDLSEPIHFAAIGCNCPWKHCFGAYTLLVHGAVPELKAPSYDIMRDRVNIDGEHWLTPTVKKFFSGKFMDDNEEYSAEKKAYINAFMAMEYGNPNEIPVDEEALEEICADSLQKRNILTVMIWADSSMRGKWLWHILKNSKVKVKCMVDTCFVDDRPLTWKQSLKRKYKYLIKKVFLRKEILLLSKYDKRPAADAVIVCDYAHITDVKKELKDFTGQIIPITEMVI